MIQAVRPLPVIALAVIAAAQMAAAGTALDEAKPLLEKAAGNRGHPRWGEAAYLLGQARLALGDADGAIALWNDVWRRGQASGAVVFAAEARLATGKCRLEEFCDPGEALKCLDEALALKPELASASSDLARGLALAALGRGEEAAAIFEARGAMFGNAGDGAEAQRWGKLAEKAAGGGLAPPRRPDAAARELAARLALADGLRDGGDNRKALQLYRRVLAKSEALADRAAFGAALCQARLGRAGDALDLYGRFARKYAKSPLAPRALLYAGTLSASPAVGNVKKAREWFAMCSERHPGTTEAMAADFYDATLAWQGRKWEEARRLHRKFAEKYAGTPLADYVRQSRLPDIEARRQPGTGRTTSHHQVEVGPYDVRRKSVPLYSSTAADAELKVVPKAGYSLVDSYISMPGAEEALWSGPDPKRPSCHTYRLSNAYSSQEFAFVHGTIKPPTEGRGSLPYFDVAVPAVDIDWFDRPSWDDEDDEDARIRPVPLVDGISQWRRAQINRPTDNYAKVPPRIQLSWSPSDAATLLSDDSTPFVNGQEINVREYEAQGRHFPILLTVKPESACPNLTITLRGQGDDVNGERAIDRIHARIVKVDIDIDANRDGEINDDDEVLEEAAGGLVCVNGNSLTPVKLQVAPAGLPGKVSLLASSGGDKITVWTDTQRTTRISLPKTWNAGVQVPEVLYVEGVSPSASMRDVKLTLKYEENEPGQSEPTFSLEDKVTLTAFRLEVSKICFNHNTTAAYDDALNIRLSFDTPIGLPEYVKGSRNHPAAYIRDTSVKIKAAFSVEPNSIGSVGIYGQSDDTDGSLGDAIGRYVNFTNGVSQGYSGSGEFVEFNIDGTTPSTVFKSIDAWNWRITDLDGIDISALGIVFDRTAGHEIFTIWDYPLSPWNQIPDNSQNPWVSALDFAIGTAGCSGENDFNSMKAITQYLHSGHGLTYDAENGAPNYANSHLGGEMNLSGYILKANTGTVNCYDQASGVVTLGRLLGIGAIYKFKQPFGYINATYIVGIGLCNNPFFLSNGTMPVVAPDLLVPQRTRFVNHAFASYSDKVFDACAGPCLGDWDLNQYLDNTVDTSTAPELAVALPLYSISIGAVFEVW